MLDYVDNCYSQKEADSYNKKYKEYHLKQKLKKEQDEIKQANKIDSKTKKSILKTFEFDDTLII